MTALHTLDFDGLDLTGRTRYGTGADWWTFDTLAEGATLGNPEQITSEQLSGLLDGSLVQHDRWANREPSLRIRVKAANSRGLAYGVADLQSRTGGNRRVLGWSPPDGWGARTEFDVMTSRAVREFDDLDELRHERLLVLSMVCSPFGYSAREVTRTFSQTAPPTVTPVTVTIADGSSATGWTATSNWNTTGNTPQVSGGWLAVAYGTKLVYFDQWGAYFNTNSEFRYAPTIDTTATEFVSFTVGIGSDAGAPGFGNHGYYPSGGGPWYEGPGYGLGLFTSTPGSDAETIKPYMWKNIDANTVRVTFKVPKSSALKIGLKIYAMATLPKLEGSTTAPFVTMQIKDVTRSNVSGQATATTTREGSYLVKAAGSAPGPMTLSVTSPTTALGDVLLYSAPSLTGSGYQPDMQRWSTSPRTVSPTAISGYTYGGTMQVPLSLLPEGTYAVVVGNAGIDVQARTVAFQTKDGGVNVGASRSITGTGPAGRRAMVVGTVAVPLVDFGRVTNLTMEIKVTSGDSADEVWLYWLGDDAALSWFSSDGKKGVWVEQPVLGDPRSAVLVGDSYPGAYAPATSKLYAADTHRIDPRGTVLHVACTGASDFTLTAIERPAWLDMAADLPDTA